MASRNAWDIPLANFTVLKDDNHIHRPEGGSKAEAGALKDGEVKHTNLTLNTDTSEWEVIGFDKMYLDYELIVDLKDTLNGVIDKEVLDMLDQAGILEQVEGLVSQLFTSLAPGGGGEDNEGGIGLPDDFSLSETIKGFLNDILRKVAEGTIDIQEIVKAIQELFSGDGFDFEKLEKLISQFSPAGNEE